LPGVFYLERGFKPEKRVQIIQAISEELYDETEFAILKI
jgi:hypothetical protein